MSNSGHRRLAKAITKIENMDFQALASAAALPLDNEAAHIIGVTGPPGGGKSTLCNQIVKALAVKGPVTALLVDPASPYSGGAVLGDRIRMQDLVSNPNVYIRSLSNRGNPGGVGCSIVSIIRTIIAAGFHQIVIETIGAGQSEVKIASIADTTLVVSVPNLGDDIQAVKSGILEIADIFVINKADLPGVDSLYIALRDSAQKQTQGWIPPLCQTVATSGIGIKSLLAEVERHRQWLLATGTLLERRKNAAKFEIMELSQALLQKHLEKASTEALVRNLSRRDKDLLTKLDEAYAGIAKLFDEV